MDPISRYDDLTDERCEVGGGDGQAIHHDPFAIRLEVWLGGLPDTMAGGRERGSHERLRAALAVGPRDERATQLTVWVTHRAQQGLRPAEPEADPKRPLAWRARTAS